MAVICVYWNAVLPFSVVVVVVVGVCCAHRFVSRSLKNPQ